MFMDLQRYVRFDGEDARRLLMARPEVEPSFQRIAEELYERIREHEAAHAVFTDEAQIRRLESSMVAWLGRLFGGTYDEGYFGKTDQVGRVHVRVGVPQRYVITAMTMIRSSLAALIATPEARESLAKLLDVELAMMLESYRNDVLVRLERSSEREVATSDHFAEIMPFAIVGLDLEGRVFLVNAEAEALSGWGRDEIIGRSFVDVVIPEESRAAAASLFSAPRVVELPLRTRSGKVRQTRWRTSLSPSGHDGKEGVFAFGEDITGEVERRLETEQQSRNAAAATMVTGLAHAIRNPLNGAGLHLTLIERAAAKAGAVDTLDAVRIAGKELRRLSSFVTEFLDFAQPRPLETTRIDARTLCLRAIGKTRAVAEANGLLLETYLPRSPLVFDVDGVRLEEVLVHLVENAIDAVSSTGVSSTGGTISVGVRREPHHVCFLIEDNGPGLPDPTAPIFDPFYSTKPEGAGLGLAIVHRVVADHGGNVDVESRPGATRFRLRLPLVQTGAAI